MNKMIFLFVSCYFGCFASSEPLFFSPAMISSHLKEYSIEEKETILKDLEVVRSVCVSSKKPSANPLYIATAGGPGSRKTTILERFLRTYLLESQIVYLDPDQRGLKLMPHTYYEKSLSAFQISQEKDFLTATTKAYEKWRGASNFITLTLLEEAFANRQNIAYGTTSTGGHIGSFLSKVKEAGYEITLLLCSAKDSFRKDSIEYRNTEQKFYQSTPEDAISKGKIFPSRMETYFSYADSLYLFWSDELFEKERLAAIFSKGLLQVIDSNALDLFIDQFEKDRKALLEDEITIPSWDDIRANTKRKI